MNMPAKNLPKFYWLSKLRGASQTSGAFSPVEDAVIPYLASPLPPTPTPSRKRPVHTGKDFYWAICVSVVWHFKQGESPCSAKVKYFSGDY